MDARIVGMKAEINGLLSQIPTESIKPSKRRLLVMYRKHFIRSIEELNEEAGELDAETRTAFESAVETTHQRYMEALMKLAGIPVECFFTDETLYV
jgi:hypothetical protein